jgi:hypothetical protein
MTYTRNSVLFLGPPERTTPVSAAWLNGVDDALVALINDQTLTGVGLINAPRVITWAPSGDASLSVAVANGGVILTAGNIPAPGHAIGGLFRWRHFSGTAAEGYGVEGRVDHEGAAAIITRGNAFVAIAGDNTDNAGAMTVFRGFKFPDFSGANYSRIAARVFLRGEDPGAPIQQRGRIFGALGMQLNGGSDTTYSGGEIAPPMHGGMRTGVRYSTPMTLAAADLALGSTLIYYAPVFVPERVTLNQLGFRVTVAGAGGTVARMGLYPLARGVLGAKIAEAPEVLVDSTGDKQATVAGSVTLEAGMYMLALTSNGAPTIQWNTDYSLGGTLGTTNVDRNDTLTFSTPGSYGVLPTTPTITRTTNPGWVVPNLWLTVA